MSRLSIVGVITVYQNIKITRHRVFAGLARNAKTSTGWFYGFKLHLLFNSKGDILCLAITLLETLIIVNLYQA